MEDHRFSDDIIEKILSGLASVQEAAWYLIDNYDKSGMFDTLTESTIMILIDIRDFIEKEFGQEHRLFKLCESIRVSAVNIKKAGYTVERLKMKLQFELIPLTEELFYLSKYYLWAEGDEERMKEFQDQIPELCSNYYVNEAEETGEYRYDLSIIVVGYNKLEYTRMCVESILKTVPQNLNYELILINHGSSDGTKEFFESVRPTKQIDIAINGAGTTFGYRVVESEYVLAVSNDIILGENAVENLLKCIKSDPAIVWAVPSTPNVSNLQTIPASYNSLEGFSAFAHKNNISDPYKWEQRTRLVDPIEIMRTWMSSGKNGIIINSLQTGASQNAFPDDRLSLMLRRRGFKMMLAKDAYCYHFGSVTINDDIKKAKDAEIYSRGRKEFERVFGIDPWGTGFCYDPIFSERIVGEETTHVEILGINCGMGSNSLKIKEQLKEYCHNLDVNLLNITDEEKFLPDLNGISSEAVLVKKLDEFKDKIGERKFNYIVCDAPFLLNESVYSVLNIIYNSLEENGTLLYKNSVHAHRMFSKFKLKSTALANNWLLLKKK